MLNTFKKKCLCYWWPLPGSIHI